MLTGVPLKILTGGLALAAAAGVGAVSHKFTKPDPEKKENNPPVLKKIELSKNRKWLDTTGNSDDTAWKSKVDTFNKGENYSLDKYQHEKYTDSDTNKINGNVKKIKEACKELEKGQFSESDLGGRKTQAETWCTVKIKVKDMLKDREADLLTYTEEKANEKSDWEKILGKHKEDEEKAKLMIKDYKKADFESKKDEYRKSLREKCKELADQDANDNNENVENFKTWCVKEKTS